MTERRDGPHAASSLHRKAVRGLVLLLAVGPILTACLGGCDRQGTPPPAAPTDTSVEAPRPMLDPAETAPPPAEATPTAAMAQPEPVTPVAAATPPSIPVDGVVAYYFHRTLRCVSCLAIEANAKEAIETAYQGALDAGRLAWLPVDYEVPANWHFAADYGLETSTLILVEMRGGQPVRWKALPKTWELIGDPGGFQGYVWAEVEEYIGR